jgi:hypothetical protein
MRHFVANYDTFRKSTRRHDDVQKHITPAARIHSAEGKPL